MLPDALEQLLQGRPKVAWSDCPARGHQVLSLHLLDANVVCANATPPPWLVSLTDAVISLPDGPWGSGHAQITLVAAPGFLYAGHMGFPWPLPAARFEHSVYLALFALLPLVVVLSYRSLAGLGPVRRNLAIALRCAVIGCAILALAGLQLVRRTDDLSVVFVVDRSRSVPSEELTAQMDTLRRAAEALDPLRDRMGIIAFSGAAAVEQLPMGAIGIDRLSDPPGADETDIAGALRLAGAVFTGDVQRRIVLLSDGNENVGHALTEIDRLAAAGIPVDIVPIRYEHANEVVFERLATPPLAGAEETINLQMVLRSQRAAAGRVLLYHNEELVDLDPRSGASGYPVTLEPGPNRFTIPVPLRYAGGHRFRAVFEPGGEAIDAIPSNNEGRSFTMVSGQGRVLILTTSSDQPSALILQRALKAEKLESDVELAGERELSADQLLDYSLVILSNVARNYLSDRSVSGLAAWVRDLGGGLIMIGGDESFGAGAWMGTPIEDIMPVSFDVKSKKQIPKGALVLVMHACEIPEGNYWGERIAVEAVKALSARDLVGILQYQWKSADASYWLVPLREVGDKANIIQTIRKMDMGDMPDLDAVMRPGVESLIARKDAAARHMIIVSDFDPAPPAGDLLTAMQQNGITCSTVAIGFGGHPIDVNKAKNIAAATGGKYYSTEDPAKLPQIFIKEAQVVRRSLINETPFTPTRSTAPSAILTGGGESWPRLDGYVLTTPKPLAQIPLVRQTEDGPDPILAHWQVGSGKAVAFTSGMWHRWGDQWAAWPGFSKLWAQIARYASRQMASADFDVSTSVEGGRGRIRVEATGQGAAQQNFLTIRGNLLDPNQSATPLQLVQVGPGQYEAEFDARQAGTYILDLRASGADPDAQSATLQTALSVAYSPEYRELKTNEPLLREFAQRGGGRILPPTESAGFFSRRELPPAEQRRSVWEDLIRLMLLLFLLDVAVRRVAINPLAVLRGMRGRLAEAGAGPASAQASAATLQTLKGAREGVREKTDAGPAPDRTARYEPPQTAAQSDQALSDALGGASEGNAPVVARPSRKPPAQSESDYTSRLLRAKRAARSDSESQEPPSS